MKFDNYTPKKFEITADRAKYLLLDLIEGLVFDTEKCSLDDIMTVVGCDMTEEERDYFIGKPVYDDTGVIIDYK